jgi:hypothetical protein
MKLLLANPIDPVTMVGFGLWNYREKVSHLPEAAYIHVWLLQRLGQYFTCIG